MSLPILRGHEHRLESQGNLRMGKQNRFKDVFTRLPLADARQLRPDFTAFAIDPVTAEARRILPLDERLPSLVCMAAIETLAPLGQRVFRVARGLEFSELLHRSTRCNKGLIFLDRIKNVELQLFWHLARGQFIKPRAQ